MTLGDWVTLGFIALLGLGVWLGRRHGKQRLAAALAQAFADGGEATATAMAAGGSASVALGGVHLNLGQHSGSSGEFSGDGRRLNVDSALPAGVVAVRRGGRTVALVREGGEVLWASPELGAADGPDDYDDVGTYYDLAGNDDDGGFVGVPVRLDGVDGVQRSVKPDAQRVGAVPSGVQRRSTAADAHGWDVVAGDAGNGAHPAIASRLDHAGYCRCRECVARRGR